MEFAGYLALISIGIILSIIGGGGSLLSVPILVYLFSLDIVMASSYSLFIVGTTSLLGALLKQKEERVDMRSGIIFSGSSVVAIFSTRKWILPSIPGEIMIGDSILLTKRALILTVFALLAMTASLIILLKHDWSSADHRKQQLKFLLPVGFMTGMLAGFVGAGGGFLILPALIIFARLPFKVAVVTTLMVIGFNSLLGFLGDVMNYPINWLFLLIVTSLATFGMLLGHLFSKKIPVHYLRSSFGWIMLITAIVILVKELFL
ncbi:MAG TPA: sulfite exporter TauE/SafE family protein [Cyclobacteriaceae bacterium]|nr:sulfite exporter TauE/SafE family protein [Cyclobacteriaceae bacterium]